MKRKMLIECRGDKSRREVAEELDITPQMLGMIERGDRDPSMKLAKKISEYYKKPIEEIFFNQNRNDSCLKAKTKQAI